MWRDRERLHTPDGDFLDLDWHVPQVALKTDLQPITAVLFHGLTGSSDSLYVLGLQKALGQVGIASVAVNFRGCSGTPNWLPRGYHSGDTEDVELVMQHVRLRFPEHFIAAVGYSMGGNALCKWFGEQRDAACADAGVIVSAPFDLVACANHMDEGISRVYRNQLVGGCLEYIAAKKRMFQFLSQRSGAREPWHSRFEQMEALGSDETLAGIKSFWDFDRLITAPLNNFSSARDYYERSSAKYFLPKVTRPLWVIHSRDDPFMPESSAPSEEGCPPNIRFDISSGGGHLGFISEQLTVGLQGHIPSLRRSSFWLEEVIPKWIEKQAAEQPQSSQAPTGLVATP
ncbi:hydrolase [Allohahella marinimesophila]|uniref:Hydrolase n=1 Tax=Allohahella marinimesophila TaxID=1054972 RepID=A0ABP7NL56_9GAMM